VGLHMRSIPIITILITCICTYAVYSDEDDFAFAASLEKSGFIWLAQEEYVRLTESESSSRETKIRAFNRLAYIYAAQGSIRDQEQLLSAVIKLGKPTDPPDIQFMLYMANKKMSKNNEMRVVSLAASLDTALLQNPRSEHAQKLRKELETRTEQLISFYRKKYGQACEKGFNPFRIAVGKTKYFQSFIYKEVDKEKHSAFLKKLANDYFTPPQGIKNCFAEVPLYRGLIQEQLKNPRKAADAFVMCLTCSHYYSSRPLRKKAFLHAVANFFAANMYRECAMVGLVYRDKLRISDNPRASRQERESVKQINTSIEKFKKSNPEEYAQLVKAASKGNAVMGVSATSVSVGKVRRYVVKGSGGSAATVDMPEQKVKR